MCRFVVHLCTPCPGKDPRQALEPAVDQLLAAAEREHDLTLPGSMQNGGAKEQHATASSATHVLLRACWLQPGSCAPSAQLPANVAVCQLPHRMVGGVSDVEQAQQLHRRLFAGDSLFAASSTAGAADDDSDEEAADALDAALAALQSDQADQP